jgi:hypothetical protein
MTSPSIRETGSPTGLLSKSDIVAAYGDKSDRILRTLDDEKAFYQAKSSIALNTPAEDAALIESLKPNGQDFKLEAERRDHAVQAVVQKYDALNKDPVSYAMSASQDLRNAYKAAENDPAALRKAVALSDALQERLGVPEQNRRTLSDEQAKNMVSSITKVAPETAADAMQHLATQYGDQLWPRVYGDLVKAKLPPEYTVLATTDNPIARKALAEALKSEAADKGALRRGLAPDDAKAIDEGVTDAMKEFRASLAYAPNGSVLADRYARSAELLATNIPGRSTPERQQSARCKTSSARSTTSFNRGSSTPAHLRAWHGLRRIPPTGYLRSHRRRSAGSRRRSGVGRTAPQGDCPGRGKTRPVGDERNRRRLAAARLTATAGDPQ